MASIFPPRHRVAIVTGKTSVTVGARGVMQALPAGASVGVAGEGVPVAVAQLARAPDDGVVDATVALRARLATQALVTYGTDTSFDGPCHEGGSDGALLAVLQSHAVQDALNLHGVESCPDHESLEAVE